MTGDTAADLTRRRFAIWLLAILSVGGVMRGLFPAADPPWSPSVGIVWHDEGAWVHNARNKALFGSWVQDEWNPLFIAPVFTALEYAAFATLGVGVRQARLVPELLGLVSVALLGLGVARIAGRRAGLAAAALLATNYVYVMWNRAALMEAPMTAFLVASWYCYTRMATSARWAWGAAACAWLAFFTKAAAAFYVGALALDAVLTFVMTRHDAESRRRAAILILALVVCGAAAVAAFVVPNWRDYWFYNVQMSITRKPSYDLSSLVTRVTWFPVLHDLFTRMWFTVVLATAALFGLAARWRTAAPGERLLALWIVLGALELLVHDVGNERRFVFFIPPVTALAAILVVRDRVLCPPALGRLTRAQALLAAPLVGYALYVVFGSIIRLAFLYEIRPNVRLAAALAAIATAGVYATWPRLPRLLAAHTWPASAGLVLAAIMAAGQLAQYVQWAAGRSYANVEASRLIGRVLPPGTLVHGKLANGLSLENGIRPVFVGRGFGNYHDRRSRDDVRYILTYTAPSLGYESQRSDPVILEVLEAYPRHAIIMSFDVRETTTGHDRAALIDKFGGDAGSAGRTDGRAHD